MSVKSCCLRGSDTVSVISSLPVYTALPLLSQPLTYPLASHTVSWAAPCGGDDGVRALCLLFVSGAQGSTLALGRESLLAAAHLGLAL